VHFRFNGPTPEALVMGRERIYFEHFWNNFAADKTRSIPEADRRAYATAYARPGRMRAGWAYFVSFQQAAHDFARLSQTKLTMPVLSIGGEKSNGDALGKQVKLVATNASSVVLPNTGHWIMEERPQETTDALIRFLNAPPTTASSSPASSVLPQMRLTPAEVRANLTSSTQVGSSGLPGVSTTVLFGKRISPEVLFLCSYINDSIGLVKAMNATGLSAKCAGGAMIDPQNGVVKTELGALSTVS
jgi:hypothetical protein